MNFGLKPETEDDKRLKHLEHMRTEVVIQEDSIFRKCDSGTIVERFGGSPVTYRYRVSNFGFVSNCSRKKLNVTIRRIEGLVAEHTLLTIKDKSK